MEKLRSAERWTRGEEWAIKRLKKNDWEYSYYKNVQNIERFSRLQYRIFSKGSRQEQEYDPLYETPHAYLRFARLGDFENLGWNDQKLVHEILRFFTDYGPLWSDLNPPLTIETVLYSARLMASTVKTYQLLTAVENRDKPCSVLNKFLQEISRTDPNPIISKIIYRSGIKGRVSDEATIRIPDELTDEEVILVAKRYVEERVQVAQVGNQVGDAVYPTLVFEQRDRNLTSESGWIPEYVFVNLLSILWFQFFQDIVNNSKLKECANEKCRSFFVPARSDQVFCTTYCRNTTNVRNSYYSKKNKKEQRV